MKDSCSISTPRIAVRNTKRSAYWWSEDISNLRVAAIEARRRLTRKRRKKDVIEEIVTYKLAKGALRSAIKKAKNNSWDELMASLNKDPWGLSYKMVMGRLRRSVSTLSETLERNSLQRLLDSLFPSGARRGILNLT